LGISQLASSSFHFNITLGHPFGINIPGKNWLSFTEHTNLSRLVLLSDVVMEF
jgi:hypothetical protein